LKKILITGSSGLLGSSLVCSLKSQDLNVLTLSRDGKNTDLKCDLTKKNHVFKILDDLKPEIIVNLAAQTDVDKCEIDPNNAYLGNIKVPLNISEWLSKNMYISHVIHISTDQVYGQKKIHKEEDTFFTNIYGLTKYSGEIVFKNLPHTILRTNFVGRSNCKNRSSLSDWAVRSAKDKKEITVFKDIFFSPLSMKTLIEMIEMIIQKPITGTFNLGSKGSLSKAEFIMELIQGLDLSTRNVRIDNSDSLKLIAPRPKNMVMDSGLFENAFKIKMPSIDREIARIIEEYENES